MNETVMNVQETVTWGRMVRWLTAVSQKLLNGLCLCEWGMSPSETWMFMIYCGFGWDEAREHESIMHLNQNVEQAQKNRRES